MTEAQAIEAIYQQWATGWNASHPAIPYTFENEVGDSTTSWVRVSVQHTTRQQRTQGRPPYRKYDCRGNVMVQLFSPINAGRATLSGLLDDARTVLEGISLAVGGGDCVYLYAGRTQEVPTDGAWFMAVLVVPFRYVETR